MFKLLIRKIKLSDYIGKIEFIKSHLILFLTLTFLISGCVTRQNANNYFEEYVDKEEITIVLNSYGLESIPAEIGNLQKVKTLTISFDTLKEWTVYPPLSAWGKRVDSPPFQILPDEITELRSLKRLTIRSLDISRLPENFDQLKELEYLDISMNKLTITNELNKLKKLTSLKYLRIIGNRIDTLMIQNWEKENQDLEIVYRIE